MVRIVIKGGVWKNTEDEILKAAVMKYGKNQWARISSLLTRKAAKQCKARWYEWLDPSIKKTEWTRQEEEKLLHLAKIMPTQWRTIAPIIGRTASQCLEHYERLLDAAQEKDDYDPKDDPRRLRPGEIDPNPEAKPARPDPKDMDEDEKEMLSEARARLANTKGKKAKRKAREKAMQEARRLASLQKRRELAAAGIELRKKKKRRKHLDYNEEIPFEKRAPAGFYNILEERVTGIKAKDDPSFLGVDLEKLEGERLDLLEERARKQDAKRQKLHKKNDLPSMMQQINKMNDPMQIRRRSKMVLPAPQVTDEELEEIAAMGGDASVPGGGGGAAATRTLLSAGGATPRTGMPTPQRTPRTPMGRDHIRMETQNLIALTNAQTPLKGGENTPLHPSDFRGATPRSSVVHTPSSMSGAMTPYGNSGGATPTPARGGSTPMRTPGGSTPMSTPLRDQLGINEAGGLDAEQAMMANSKRQERRRQSALKKKLQAGLSSLPAATNEYGLVMPEMSAEEVKDDGVQIEEDAEDRALRIVSEHKAVLDANLARRHLVLQRALPRPVAINNSSNGRHGDGTGGDMDAMFNRELTLMLRYDAVVYPVGEEDTKKKSKRRKKQEQKLVPAGYKLPSDDMMAQARDLVAAELSEMKEKENGLEALKGDLTEAWNQAYGEISFLPSTKRYGQLSSVSSASRLQALKQQFELLREHHADKDQRAAKLQQRLTITTGGYTKVSAQHKRGIKELHDELVSSSQKCSCFTVLADQEQKALPLRITKLKRESENLKEKEAALQLKYASLMEDKEQLTALLAQ